MKIASTVVMATAAVTLVVSGALAQQNRTGMVTTIDRINGTIAIQPTQSGTVGANTGGAAEIMKVPNATLLGDLHAGDKVSYGTTENGGVKSVTDLKKQ